MGEVDPTYEFGAFAAAADLRTAYFDPARRRAAACLLAGLHAGEGAFVLEGEPGVGKTTLLLEIARELAAVDGALLLGQPCTIAGRAGATTLGLLAEASARLGLPAQGWMLPAFIGALATQATFRRSVAILLDDADRLPDATLRDLLSLTAQPTAGRRLLSVAFCGPPGLAIRLRRVAGRADFLPGEAAGALPGEAAGSVSGEAAGSLASEAAGSVPGESALDLDEAGRVVGLEAMNEADAARLIRHRLKRTEAGAVPFGDDAVGRAASLSGGHPGRLVTLCRTATLHAVRAGHPAVTAAIIQSASQEIGRPVPPTSAPPPPEATITAGSAPRGAAVGDGAVFPEDTPPGDAQGLLKEDPMLFLSRRSPSLEVPAGHPVADTDAREDRRGGRRRLLSLASVGIVLLAAAAAGWLLGRDSSRPIFSGSEDTPASAEGLAGPALGPADAWWRPGGSTTGAPAEPPSGIVAGLPANHSDAASTATGSLAADSRTDADASVAGQTAGAAPAPVAAGRALPLFPPAPPRPGTTTATASLPAPVSSPPVSSPPPPSPSVPSPSVPSPSVSAAAAPGATGVTAGSATPGAPVSGAGSASTGSAPVPPASPSPKPVAESVPSPSASPVAPSTGSAPPTPATILTQVTPKPRPSDEGSPTPPATARPAPAAATTVASGPRELLAAGDARRQAGDIAGARASYRRAFDAGNTDAAFRLAQTYDPRMLPAARQAGNANAETAIRWYRDAARKGDPRAKSQLADLVDWLQKRAAAGDASARRALEVWQRP